MNFKNISESPNSVISGGRGLQVWKMKDFISNFKIDTSIFLRPISIFGLNVELEEKGWIGHSLGNPSEYQ